ncbi:Zingipain-1 [Glycine max]|nr:Zingipain-1 [Glycine max]
MVWAFSVTLSVQQLVDCDPASNDCAGGFYFNAFGYVIDNGGVDTEAHYPYIAQNSTCKANANKVVSIDNLEVVVGREEALLCRVNKQPVNVTIDATGLQFYAGVNYGKKGYLLIKRNDSDEWPYGVCPINAAPGFPIKEVASSLAL